MPGLLYIVATPIGNLADVSPRALDALRSAAVVACEDTRVTRTLLARHGIAAQTVALHEHNERAAAAGLPDALRDGATVALVSDAGTPAIADPGAHLVLQAHRAGVRVVPIPGPNAAAAALSAAGFAADAYHFAGFLPPSAAGRRRALAALDLPCPVVLYEAPHRIRATLAALLERYGPDRELALARELTKKFEEIARLPLGEALAWLDADPHREKGEYVIVVGPGEARRERAGVDPELVLDTLLEVLSPADAARVAARITGESRNALYRQALERGK